MKLFCNPLFICKLVIWQTIWLLSFNVSGQQANKPLFIHMSGLNFPGAIQFDRKGAFDLFIANLNKQASINMQYDVLLPARGARLFYQKKADCVMPAAFYPPYYEGYDVIASKGYAYVDYVAFTLAENGKITDRRQTHWDCARRRPVGSEKAI